VADATKRRVWVLDTETKGTGAAMVPLENVLEKPAPAAQPIRVGRRPGPRPKPAPQPRAPRRFRVVDVVTREPLADDVSAREVLDVLGGVRSTVDVNVFVWAEKARTWRLLTLDEQRALWERRR
jgi:hypothetical protein